MTPEDILEGAIEVIERDGWHQGNPYPVRGSTIADMEASKKGPVCAIGAASRAYCGHANSGYVAMSARRASLDAYREAVERMADALDGGSVAEFNDRPTTTKEDVVLMMKRAAHEEG